MFRPGWLGEHIFCPSITVPAEKTKAEQILNTRLQLLYVTDETSMATMRRFAQAIEAGRMPDRLAEGLWDLIQGTDITAYNLYRRAIHNRPMVPKPDGVHQVYFLCQAEQAPNPDSRITLSDRRDALGSRLPVLDWRLGELDKRTLQVQGKLLGGELARLGLGLFQFDPWLRDGGNSWSPQHGRRLPPDGNDPDVRRRAHRRRRRQLPGPWPGEPLRRRKLRLSRPAATSTRR